MTEITKTIDKEDYTRLKSIAKMNGISINDAIKNAIRDWIIKTEEESPIFFIRKHKKHNVRLSDMKPFHSTNKNKTLSKDIDKIMYGA